MKNFKIRFILFLTLSSCVGNLLEEEIIEEIPEFSRDEISGKEDVYSETENFLVQFDSIEPIYMEHIKSSSIVRLEPNGEIIFKIHANDLQVHCSSENFGIWSFIGIEIKDDWEIRTISKGLVYQEIWEDDKIIATLYYVRNKAGSYVVPHLWYDENFLRGFTHKSNLLAETIPERELEKIILNGDLSKSAFDLFLWKFQFHFGGDSLNAHENMMMFYMNRSHIDGESAPDRLLLIFENDSLVAIKHDRPITIKRKAIYKCDFGLSLSIIASWEKEKETTFVNEFWECK